MVAYNFMKQFADDVASGRKDFTIRGQRKRHARPGEPVQLYTGMRTKCCHKLVDPDPICLSVRPIVIKSDLIMINGKELSRATENLIIVLDGFKTRDDFFQFHLNGSEEVHKWLIRWSFFNDR